MTSTHDLEEGPSVPDPVTLCDHRCLLPDNHVERGELHWYGYILPSTETIIATLTTERDAWRELAEALDALTGTTYRDFADAARVAAARRAVEALP